MNQEDTTITDDRSTMFNTTQKSTNLNVGKNMSKIRKLNLIRSIIRIYLFIYLILFFILKLSNKF